MTIMGRHWMYTNECNNTNVQVLLVTGGINPGFVSTTEVSLSMGTNMQNYKSPFKKSFQKRKSSGEPIFFLFNLITILWTGGHLFEWQPTVAELWQEAGHLAVGRDSHAAVAVPASIVQCSGCSAMSFSALDHLLVAVSFFISQKCLQIGKAEWNSTRQTIFWY